MYINENLGTMTLNQADGMEVTDVLKANQKANYNRRLMAIALTGGSAVMDSKIELWAGKVLVASLANMLTTHTPARDELIPVANHYFLQEDLGTMTLNDTDGMTKTPNLKQIEEWGRDRIIEMLGLSGGSAEGDSAIELMSGRTSLAKIYNQTTDETIKWTNMISVKALNPKNTPLIIKCIDTFDADCHVGILYRNKGANRGFNIPANVPLNIVCTDAFPADCHIHMLMVP